ncbi:MAG: hypothetical protein CMP21_08645 [Rickettsiales bacterium]|nr:hypothetical protein [Rickettsiales bacterium]
MAEQAARALAGLAYQNRDNQKAIANAVGIVPLVVYSFILIWIFDLRIYIFFLNTHRNEDLYF